MKNICLKPVRLDKEGWKAVNMMRRFKVIGR